MLDRYLLRYFLAVIDQGNFSRAAAYCNVSQPTLSVGIAKLERTLGLSLFVRSNQRVELTEGGTRFQAHARRIEREFNLAMDAMAETENLPALRIGVLSTVPGAIVATAVARAQPKRRHRLELLFGSERELTAHLAKGRVDVALTLVERGADRFPEKPIRTEGYALAMAAGHPLAGRREIAAEQLAGETMIVRRHCEALSDTSRFFTERGVRPHFALRSTNDERVLQMVAAGLGITVMPQDYQAEGVTRPRLSGFDQTRTLGWAASHGAESLLHAPPPVMAEIVKQLENLAKPGRMATTGSVT
jgi:DNA-binding transcriptional LysR family regulator